MAVVKFDYEEVEKLSGKNDLAALVLNIPMLGMTVEKFDKAEKALEVDITPDRLDMLTNEGLARALSSFLGIKKGLREYSLERLEKNYYFKVDSNVSKIRPFVVSAAVKDLDLKDIEGIMQVQEKIHDTYGRKRKKVAIGIHDLDKLKPPFTYYAASPKEKFVPLDKDEEMSLEEILKKHEKGIDYAHLVNEFDKYPLIKDEEGVVSFPPIINAERTKVTEGTNNLFIEMTGTSITALMNVLNTVCCSFADNGGRIFPVEIRTTKEKYATPDLLVKEIELNPDEVNALLGTNLTKKDIDGLLERMGYYYDGKIVKIPPYRVDIMEKADIIEDVAIAYGYNNLEPVLPMQYSVGRKTERSEKEEKIALALIGMNGIECVNFSLTNTDKNNKFMMLNKEKAFGNEQAEVLRNPLTSDYTMVRTWLIPSVLANLSNNDSLPQRIFEIGSIAVSKKEKRSLAFLEMGEGITFTNARRVLETLAHELNWNIQIKEKSHPSFIEGRIGVIVSGDEERGVIGELHPQVIRNFGLEYPVSGFEICL